MRRTLVLAVLSLGAIARAQSSPDAGVVDEAAIEHAHPDSAASLPAPPPPPPPPPSAAAPVAASGGVAAGVAHLLQALNPEIGAVVDVAAGWYHDDDGTIKSGDDPQATGVSLQRLELSLQAEIDRWFRAELYLAIPNLSGLEVDEAYLSTTGLPAGLQITAGIFRAGLGRQNGEHLHQQDFTRRPSLSPQLLGPEGLRAPGVELAWQLPRLPFPLVVAASIFSVAPAAADQPLGTFGGGARWDFAYVATARAAFTPSRTTALQVGLSYAHGKTSQRVSRNDVIPSTASGLTLYDNYYDNLFGADLTLRWRPLGQHRTSVAWQTEFFLRQIPDLLVGGMTHPQAEGALYSQLVVQTHRRWYLGLRGELGGIPAGDNLKREYAGAASATFAMSERSRLRLYGELRYGPRFLPLDVSDHPARVSGALFLQLEASLGAHGERPF